MLGAWLRVRAAWAGLSARDALSNLIKTLFPVSDPRLASDYLAENGFTLSPGKSIPPDSHTRDYERARVCDIRILTRLHRVKLSYRIDGSILHLGFPYLHNRRGASRVSTRIAAGPTRCIAQP